MGFYEELVQELVQAIGKRIDMEVETVVAASPSMEKVIPVKDRPTTVCLKFRTAVDAERFRLATLAFD